MNVSWRWATSADIPRMVDLYVPALAEQTELREAWAVAEGLPEPLEDAFASVLSDRESLLVVGLIDDLVFGLLWARVEPLLPQAGGERIGVVRLVYVDDPARTVGVGEAMLGAALDESMEIGGEQAGEQLEPVGATGEQGCDVLVFELEIVGV